MSIRTATPPPNSLRANQPRAPAVTVGVGAGGAFVLGAKLFFLAAGFLQQAILPQLIGLADYGALARVLSSSNIFNNVTVTASVQSMSRLAAQSGQQQTAALRFALRTHVLVAAFAAGGLALAAPAIGAFQHAPHIVVPLTVMALVLFVYSIYAPLVGALNGRRMFAKQATLDIIAAVLRTCGFAVGGYLLSRRGHGTLGAVIGAAVAALCMLPLAVRFAAPFRADSAPLRLDGGVGVVPVALPSGSTYARSVVGIIAAQLCINFLMQSDLTMLGRQLSISAELLHLKAAARQADEWVGVYRACQLFAFLPYQLLVSVTSVLFPMLAKAAAEGDRARVTSLSQRGVRIGVLFAGLMVTVIIAFPESLIRLAYSAEIAKPGGSILPILAASQGIFAILSLATTILTSLGHEVRAGIINGFALVVVALSVYLLGPRFAFGAAQLHFVALATGAAMLGALLVAWPVVHAKAGGFLSWFTALRVVALVCLIAAVARQVPTPDNRVTTLVALAVVASAYVLLLPVLGLVSGAEIRAMYTFVMTRFVRKV